MRRRVLVLVRLLPRMMLMRRITAARQKPEHGNQRKQHRSIHHATVVTRLPAP
jgi:hypothetical protein